MGSEGRREDVGPRRLRDRVRPPDEPARRELPAQPAAARQVSLGQAFGTNFTYSLGDPNQPNFGYPVDPALQTGLDEHNGVRGARVSLTTVDTGLRSPYAHTWFVGVQREISGTSSPTRTTSGPGPQPAQRLQREPLRGRHARRPVQRVQPELRDHQPRHVDVQVGLQRPVAVAERPSSNSYMFQGAYTFGKAMDDTDQAVGATNTQDAANLDAEWALAGYDVTHKLSFVAMWELPFFRNSAGLTKALLGGWQLQGYGVFQTGNPISVTNSAAYPAGDYNADNNAGDRPNAPSRREDRAAGRMTSTWPASSGPPTSRGRRPARTATSLATPTGARVLRGQPVAGQEVRPWRLVQRRGPPRRVQRVQHHEPGRPGDGPEQRQLRQVDHATGDAGDAVRPPPPVLTAGGGHFAMTS